MSYETGGATGPNDLLDKIRVFALALGWTVDYFGARTSGSSNQALLINQGGVFLGFVSDVTTAGTADDPAGYLGSFTYPGPYVNTTDKADQANRTVLTFANKMPGPFQAYHLFGTATYLHAVVEAQPGSFRHIGAGTLAKAGAVTSGAYSFGSRWNYNAAYVNSIVSGYHAIPWDGFRNASLWRGTGLRVDKDGVSPQNIELMDSASDVGALAGGWAGFYGTGNDHAATPVRGLMALKPSDLTGRAPLFPLIVSVFRPSSFVSLVGAAPDIRVVRMDNLSPGDAVTLGPDTWRVFPVIRKNGASGQENSGLYGFAYRVVP